MLSGSIITNVTARDLRKLEIKVGISYDSDIKKAKAILKKSFIMMKIQKDDQGMVVFVDKRRSGHGQWLACVVTTGEILACQVAA